MLHQFRTHAKSPEQTSIVHLQPPRFRTIEPAQLLNLVKEELDDAQCKLRLVLEYVVGNVDEAPVREQTHAVVAQLWWVRVDTIFELSWWLQANTPHAYSLLKHITKSGEVDVAFELWMYLQWLAHKSSGRDLYTQ